jgi:hypothetical protein
MTTHEALRSGASADSTQVNKLRAVNNTDIDTLSNLII